MKHCPAEMIWYMCLFWVGQVCSNDLFSLGKQNTITGGRNAAIFSVRDMNLASCAVTCYKDSRCMNFVYTESDKRCDGYVEFHTTASYRIIFWTGNERDYGTKADLLLNIVGSCGSVAKTLKNGKDFRLRRGHMSRFRFVDASVCHVQEAGLAFVEPCHSDDWFVEYIDVWAVNMETGKKDVWFFRTDYWLDASDNGKRTTGITCVRIPAIMGLFAVIGDTGANCSSSQICEDV